MAEGFLADNRIIRFLGGKTTLFILIVLMLVGINVMIFDKISFIFYPIRVLFSVVVLPIVLATILYYLLRPLLQLLERARIPKVWGIAIIFLTAIGLITLLVFLVLPFLKLQFWKLVDEFPTYFNELILTLDSFFSNSIFAPYYNQLNINAGELLDSGLENIGQMIADALGGIALGLTTFISKLTGILLSIVTVPIILFYLLKDGHNLPGFVQHLLPPRMRDDAESILGDADKQISAYIQGQILVAVCIGTMVTIGFLIIDMKYALLLGVLAMFTSVVPYLGPVIAITPAIIIAIVTSPFMLVKLAVVWTIVQVIEGKFISPQIMGKTMHIHPITIIFVLLTGGSLFGIPGVILGIPGYALIKVLATHLFKLFKIRYNKYEVDVRMHYERPPSKK
ncbi:MULTISPECIES: AI-2E family transporter [Sporosarcina]|uniref:AI-2E family transporter n=1 Tax=Sporosarcina TaxID=1569 RepID=UPI00058CCC69|nr:MULTISPECIES: AI-2E family transporter [Sporosarcina]WJY28971.1 AI-2E family transporter [Sporosarcina sp. 0.2-SM1T-5]